MRSNPNILLIEDDAKLAANLSQVLEDEDFRVSHCARGVELTNDGRVAAEFFAECDMGHRLLLEALRK